MEFNDVERVKESQISLLMHPWLKNNEIFIFLKKELESFYKFGKAPTSTSNFMERSRNWGKHLYSNLHQLLKEVIMTEDPDQQSKALAKVHKWYQSNIITDISPQPPRKNYNFLKLSTNSENSFASILQAYFYASEP